MMVLAPVFLLSIVPFFADAIVFLSSSLEEATLSIQQISPDEYESLSDTRPCIGGAPAFSMNIDNINARGFGSLLSGQFEDALADFNYVLYALRDINQPNEPMFGAALWGRLLCHAYADLEQDTLNDLSLIRAHFIGNSCRTTLVHTRHYSVRNSGVSIFRIADFADPNERLSPDQCKERVRGTANVMRILAMKVPNRALAEAISFTITELEYAACRCCERNHWTECLGPIVDGWNYLRMCMDKGAAIAPNLVGPGR